MPRLSTFGLILLALAMIPLASCRREPAAPETAASPAPSVATAGDEEAIAITQSRLLELAYRLEDHLVDTGSEPEAATIGELVSVLDISQGAQLSPTDGWGRDLVVSTVDGQLEIRSLGRDGVRDAGPPAGPVTDPDADIVIIDGGFTQWHLE